MRANEFINEDKKGGITKRQSYGTVGLHLFKDPNGDRAYNLNRVMMATAMADGSDTPIDMDSESWAGRTNIAAPYTKEEHDMLKQAYKAVGSVSTDLNHGDLRSQEPPGGHPSSPIKAFKGYPR